ncbi:YihY/virulence factor BrkB family protein [Halobellus captivus]|uniref:YihY/virulence factor BrkB family protein n=1 Tax=Halobellus captivus TaxID=2592614 RepID=UPI0011A8824D|nr:YihY/virulence factor BrkB family protein [Halobellus captivus]
MSASTADRLAVPRSIVETVREREVAFLAAGISYYVLVSLIPLLTLAVVVATIVGGADLAAAVQSIAAAYLLPTGSDLVSSALADPTGRGTLSVFSLLLTLWGTLKLFRGVDVAFAKVYGYPTSPILEQLSDGLVTLASLGAATLGVVAATTVLALVDVPFIELLSALVLLGFLVASFLPLYVVIPDVEVGVASALPGAVFAAVGWTVLSTGFGIYARVSSGVAGALGAVLLLVTWFYLSGILVLTGAAVNAVLAGQVGGVDRQLQHPPGRRDEQTMSADDATNEDAADESVPEGDPSFAGDADSETELDPRGAPDIEQLDRRIEELRADLDAFESDVQSRTVDRPDVEGEMRRYVRGRLRRGKARGWGPYLVLLYGTAATIAAFYFLQDDLLAVAAMVVIYLSTLGLYTLFVVFGVGLNALGVPGRLVDWVRDRRS